MAQIICYMCNGTGSYLETQRVPSTTGGMFQEIEVRQPCSNCGGSGFVWAPDPDPDPLVSKVDKGKEKYNSEPKDYYLLLASGLAFIAAYYIGKLIYHIGLNFMTKDNEMIISLTVIVISIAAFLGVFKILQRKKIRNILEQLFNALLIMFALYGLYLIFLG